MNLPKDPKKKKTKQPLDKELKRIAWLFFICLALRFITGCAAVDTGYNRTRIPELVTYTITMNPANVDTFYYSFNSDSTIKTLVIVSKDTTYFLPLYITGASHDSTKKTN